MYASVVPAQEGDQPELRPRDPGAQTAQRSRRPCVPPGRPIGRSISSGKEVMPSSLPGASKRSYRVPLAEGRKGSGGRVERSALGQATTPSGGAPPAFACACALPSAACTRRSSRSRA